MEDNAVKKDSGLLKKASKDFVFSILALVIYNGVLSLLVNPRLNAQMGKAAMGIVLFFTSVVSTMSMGFGTAASYSRMMAKKDREEKNGDYNIFLLMICAIAVPVTLISISTAKVADGVSDVKSAGFFVAFFVLTIATVFRYYADVQYRMTIRFKDYFIFFSFTSLGYVLGLLLYPVTKSWILVFLLGELFGIGFTVASGNIFRAPFFEKSKFFKENIKSAWYISGSNLVGALILNSDRLLLTPFAGPVKTTVYYTASLMGKVVAMITTPLNGIVISYLINYKVKMDKKRFGIIGVAFLGATVIGAVACCVASMIFVRLFYPLVYDEASKYFFVANLGQMLYFISGSLMVVLLAFTKEKLQFVINLIYGIIFAVVLVPVTYLWGLGGYAYGLVVVNAVRFIIVILIGIKNIK
ncbi:MAG: hypothetical protein J5802_03690 [Butyrivibrio sp.]|nr:hypothetical protein [Butyrivibrio sp.]